MSGFIACAVRSLGKKIDDSVTINKKKKESDKAFKKKCERYMKANGAKGMGQLNVSRKGLAKREARYFDSTNTDVTEKVRTIYA
jgi:hypothetical protein